MKVKIVWYPNGSYELFINNDLIYIADGPDYSKEENYSMALWYLANYCAQYYNFDIVEEEKNV